MKISSQAHYGLQAAIILTKKYPESVSATELERLIGVSKKYLERIMRSLSNAGLVLATRGVSGGYALKDEPKNISCGQVIRTLEKDLKIVDCLGAPCSKKCESLFVWTKLYTGINEILNSISLYDATYNKGE